MDGPHGPKGSLVSDGHGDSTLYPSRPQHGPVCRHFDSLLLPIFAMLVLLQLSALFVLSPSPSDPYLATCF
jgi:hypothetical protein